MTTFKYFTAVMPVRRGWDADLEKQAKDLAGGVGRHDIQGWIPPVKTPIVYPPGKNLQTKIPLESSWNEFQPGCYPVCRHTPDQCPTHPQYPAKSSWARPPVPSPEGHRLPDETVVNKMTFDENPWLDSAPLDVQAKAGYTNFHNDLIAEGDLLPGEYWAEGDRQHRKALSAPKLCTSDVSRPPKPLRDSVASLRGRQCRNCLGRIPEDAHGRVEVCSERCRNRSEYIRSSGQVGTVHHR